MPSWSSSPVPGDPFASKNFRTLMQEIGPDEYPDLKVRIMTNGMLLNPREWARFPHLHGRTEKLRVSLDAATGPTHERLRRGARWDVMLENLAFFGRLAREHQVESFELTFVVQRDNYREMGDFVDLAHRVGADVAFFASITNWGTFSDADFAQPVGRQSDPSGTWRLPGGDARPAAARPDGRAGRPDRRSWPQIGPTPPDLAKHRRICRTVPATTARERRMLGTMQDMELRVPRLIDHAAREHGTPRDRQPLGRRQRDAHRLGGHPPRRAKAGAGAGADGREARRPRRDAGMNHSRHLVAWYGAIGMGGVLHTINPRLFDDQLVYIANHAEDRVLLYDKAFQPIVDRLRDQWTTIEHYIVFDGEGPDSFERVIAAEDGDYAWVEGPEREPCMLCYTSGTTGNPKGVLYTHRSTVIHALAEMQPAVFDLDSTAVALPVVPMFHAAAWGLPFAGAAAGIKFVYSAVNEPKVLCELMNREKVTHSAGVPTVWLAMFQHMDATGETPSICKIVTIGGSAAPRAMIERIMKMGVRVNHAWGMTETSPIGTMGAPSADWDELTFEEKVDVTVKQGRVPFGVELRIVDEDDRELPRDGVASGRLQIRGPWIIRRYFKAEADATDADGWFDTGDVAVAPPRRDDADHRPRQGRHQVGRRVDQLGRARECRGRLRRRGRGGGDRRAITPNGTNARSCWSSASPTAR